MSAGSTSSRPRPRATQQRSPSPSHRSDYGLLDDDSESEEVIFAGQPFSGTTRYVVGVLFLFIVNLTWVACDILTKYIYDDDTFEKPLFITYFNTSLFSIYLIGFALPSWRAQWKNKIWVPVDDSEGEEQTSEHRGLLSAEFLPATEPGPEPVNEVFEEEGEREGGGGGGGCEGEVIVEEDEEGEQGLVGGEHDEGIEKTSDQLIPEASSAPSKPQNLPMNIRLTAVIKSDSDVDSEALDDTDALPILNSQQSEDMSPLWLSLADRANSLPNSPMDAEASGRLLSHRQRRRLHRSLSQSPTSHSPRTGLHHSQSTSSVTSLRSCLKNSSSGSSLVMPRPVPVPELRARRLSLTAPVFKPLHVRREEEENMVVSVPSPVPSPESAGEERTQKVLLVRQDSKVRFSLSEEVRALPAEEYADANFARLSFEAAERRRKVAREMAEKLKLKDIIRLAGVLMAIWFAANYFLQLATVKSSQATRQIFSSSSSLFVLVLAVIIPACKFERFSITKTIVVLVCIAGAVLVGISNTQKTATKPPQEGGPSWDIGILYSILGAFFYSLFVILLKRRVGPLQHISVPLFLGVLGAWCVVTMWPLVLVFHYAGVEKFVLPNKVENSTHVWTYLAVNGVFGTVLSSVMWLLGVFFTSPLVGIIALLFVSPIDLIYQLTRAKVKFSIEYAVGFAMITIGFILATWLAKRNYPDPVLTCLRSFWRRDTFSTWSDRNALSHYWRRKQ